MNRLIFLLTIILCLGTNLLHGQNIKELFLDFPESVLGEKPSRETRQKFLTEIPWGNAQPLAELKTIDLANGFILLERRDLLTHMCYWKKDDGTRLIAITNTTKMYPDSELRFFHYKDGEWTRLSTDYILTKPDFFDMIDIQATREANNGKDIPSENLINYSISVILPQFGKNIKIQININDVASEYRDYKMVAKKNVTQPDAYDSSIYEFSYKWNNGVFLSPFIKK